MVNLSRLSNVGEPGRWIFQVGPLGEHGNVIEPDTAAASGEGDTSADFTAGDSSPDSCAAGGRVKCHARAKCQDTESGFCCK